MCMWVCLFIATPCICAVNTGVSEWISPNLFVPIYRFHPRAVQLFSTVQLGPSMVTTLFVWRGGSEGTWWVVRAHGELWGHMGGSCEDTWGKLWGHMGSCEGTWEVVMAHDELWGYMESSEGTWRVVRVHVRVHLWIHKYCLCALTPHVSIETVCLPTNNGLFTYKPTCCTVHTITQTWLGCKTKPFTQASHSTVTQCAPRHTTPFTTNSSLHSTVIQVETTHTRGDNTSQWEGTHQ